MKIIVSNLAVMYEENGNGPVMLFLHGWGNNSHSFDALVPLLAGSWRVIRLDLPGFGGSEAPKEPWGVGEYAQFVEEFIEKLGVSVEVLVGHSFGGRIAIKGIAGGVLRPNKLVLIGSAGVEERNTVRNTLFKLAAKAGNVVLSPFPERAKEYFRRKLYERAGANDYLKAGALKNTFVRVMREDLSSSARAIQVPTLLVWGKQDAEAPLSHGRRLNSFISGSKLEIIKAAGHFVHQEKPQEMAEFIRKFVM